MAFPGGTYFVSMRKSCWEHATKISVCDLITIVHKKFRLRFLYPNHSDCLYTIDHAYLPLVFAPESGNMLGGTVVNITGPCFDPNERIMCTFDTEHVVGHVVDRNRAICVQPFLLAQGYIRFLISVGNDRYKWRGEYFVGECN